MWLFFLKEVYVAHEAFTDCRKFENLMIVFGFFFLYIRQNCQLVTLVFHRRSDIASY